MAKPQEIQKAGYEFFFWPYEEQTKMKHKVLTEYSKIWITKLGKYNTVNFFDCYGGCGAYWENDNPAWGSSILIAKESQKICESLNRDIRKVNIFVSENDRSNFINLKKVIEFCNLSCKPRLAEMAFEDMIMKDGCIALYAEHPSLFFIDPFGYSLDYSLLEQIMKYPKNELLINFMFDYINRFISFPEQADRFDKLFGCSDWRGAVSLTGLEREKKIVSIFKRQLKQFAKYVFAYKLSFFDKDRTYYYIFHATDHLEGCSIMKSCFASLNNGKVEYLGNRSDVLTLFDLSDFKLNEVKDYLINKFAGMCLTFKDIIDQTVDDTLYLEKDIRAALKDLKSDHVIQTKPVTSQTERGLNGEDVITFRGWNDENNRT